MNKIQNVKYGLMSAPSVLDIPRNPKNILTHCMDILGALIGILICVGALGMLVFGFFIAPWM